MRYYTKEWYNLMQRQNYTCGLNKIPDKVYSDREIRAFYEQDLQAEIDHDHQIHIAPSDYSWAERLLQPDTFQPENFLFFDDETGTEFHPETPEIARSWLQKEKEEADREIAQRPPFDPAETIACFRDCYRSERRYCLSRLPEWVAGTVDPRLLALHRCPESVWKRLRKEEQANQRTFQKIEKEAAAVLTAQDIPEAIHSQFHFHDSNLLWLKKVRSDYELTMRICFDWPQNTKTPYIKVIFRQVSLVEREPGWRLRPRPDQHGTYDSNCHYLYDELYKTDDGYEVHMLLWTASGLRTLTVHCRDIDFENNLQLPTETEEHHEITV